MNKICLILTVSLLFILSGCKSYSPEVQSKIDECKNIIGWGECEMNLAIEQNDASICRFIKNRHYKEVCKIAVARNFEKCKDIESWDFSEVEFKKDESFNTDIYFQKMAAGMLNPSRIETIKTCFMLAAKLQSNIKICDEIKNEQDRNSCKMQFPDQYSEVDFCRSKEEKYEKDNCFRNYANINLDTKFCDEISEFDNQQYCRFEIIKRINKTNACSEISKSSVWYNTCLKEFNIQTVTIPQNIELNEFTEEEGLPDFAIISLTYWNPENKQPALNEFIGYNLTYKNIGAKKKSYGAYTIRAFLNGDELRWEGGNGDFLNSYDGKELTDVQYSFTRFTQRGENRLKLVFDDGNNIKESNELNNVKEIVINID